MANLNEAYARVREQTESNYAEREKGYGVFQGAFQDILGDLNNDLNKDNVDKPLSPIGSALDSVLGFREKHIKDAAENTARLAQAQYTAEAPLRAQTVAESLDSRLTEAAEVNKFEANQKIEAITHDISSGYGGINVGAHIKKIVANDASLAPTILAAYKNKDMFRVFDKDYIGQVKDGTKIHTDGEGNQLFATGDSKVKNINKNHARLTKKFNDALRLAGITEDQLRDTSIEGRAKLFKNDKFKTVMDQSIRDVTPEMLKGHELYREELRLKFNEINTKLERDTNFYISRGKTLQTEAAYLARQVSNMDTKDIKETERLYTAKIEEIKANAKLTNRLQLNGSFQRNVQSIVFRRAYANALLTGTLSTISQAKQNIDRALQSTRNDPALKEYVRQVRAFYEGNSGDISSASPTIIPSSEDENNLEATSKPKRLEKSGTLAKAKGR